LKERFGGVVVRKSDHRAREELPLREREHRNADDAAEPTAEALPEEIHRDRNERAQHCGGEQQRKRGRLRRRTPATGDDRGRGDELAVQRAELADGLAYWKARPRVEAHRSRPVMDRIPDLPEVIPRVVTAEIHL